MSNMIKPLIFEHLRGLYGRVSVPALGATAQLHIPNLDKEMKGNVVV
jgi:hypothetical protein